MRIDLTYVKWWSLIGQTRKETLFLGGQNWYIHWHIYGNCIFCRGCLWHNSWSSWMAHPGSLGLKLWRLLFPDSPTQCLNWFFAPGAYNSSFSFLQILGAHFNCVHELLYDVLGMTTNKTWVNEYTSICPPRNNVSLRVCPIIDHHLCWHNVRRNAIVLLKSML